MNPELVAYTAGIFDGEGSISLSHRGKTKGTSLRVSITNTDINVLIALRQDWDNIGTISIRTSKANWKPRADWRMGSAEARDFLAKLLP